ncbi:TIR domain-containing protein [Blastopirellula marina]|uniref:TIR domain-containing protein n=1 Tax=Blastopirellula marina TaxID=124 RepID=UPI00032280CB
MYKYDFGFSFAGEDREYAKALAQLVKRESVRVFYDEDFEADLWGQDVYQGFQQVYGKDCRFFVPFISANYIAKNLELPLFLPEQSCRP